MENVSKEKEQIIISAARKRFAHYGFSKATMDEIAVDVDMGKASLYYYFPTKESLFQAVLNEELNEFLIEMESILATDMPASSKLVELVKKRLEFFRQSLNLGSLSYHTFNDTNQLKRKFFSDLESKELALINRILSEGKSNGEFEKRIDPESGVVLLHVLQGLRIRTLKYIKSLEMNEETFNLLQSEMNIFLKIFIKGISKKNQ